MGSELQLGLELKEAGLDQVELHGERFVDWARRVAIAICRDKGVVNADEIRLVADNNGIAPHHPNAWGAIFRGKEWVPVGFMQSEHPSNHGRVIRTWRYEEEVKC